MNLFKYYQKYSGCLSISGVIVYVVTDNECCVQFEHLEFCFVSGCTLAVTFNIFLSVFRFTPFSLSLARTFSCPWKTCVSRPYAHPPSVFANTQCTAKDGCPPHRVSLISSVRGSHVCFVPCCVPPHSRPSTDIGWIGELCGLGCRSGKSSQPI